MPLQDKTAVANSALWAAYGDALGFITELADVRTLQFRTHAPQVIDTVPWKRTIGGRFGAIVQIPVGCYSDDTQLRLATCRAIRGDGYFDVEAFAKVELPVWLSYALGAGTSTKTAASSLSRPDVNWFSNFYAGKGRSTYIEGGGNGAAMRIQPHVWAAKQSIDQAVVLRDVIRNSVCTHGHPRAIAGACFHALCLRSALDSGEIPSPEFWRKAVSSFPKICAVIREDTDLRSFWLPVWEERSKSRIEHSFETVANEVNEDLARLEGLFDGGATPPYSVLVQTIDASRPEVRGSGTKTALLASALCWAFKNIGPQQAIQASANFLESDTDTVGTMAGAIFGAVADAPPRGELLDHSYIANEAHRLWDIGQGISAKSFQYPDLMNWRPPKTMLDAVNIRNGSVVVEGLGEARPFGGRIDARTNDGSCWQWLSLGFGQSILAKQRIKLKRLDDLANLRTETNGSTKEQLEQPVVTTGEFRDEQQKRKNGQSELFPIAVSGSKNSPGSGSPRQRTLDELTSEAIRSGFNNQLIGSHLMELAELPDGIELAMGYAAVIVKARSARILANSKKDADSKLKLSGN